MASVLSGISLTCFGASYAVAWALELSHLVLRRGRQWLLWGFVLAGFLAHTLYLGYRVVELSASPLSSPFDWCLVAAWLLMASFLYLSWYFPRAGLGLYMLPLTLLLVAAATQADRTPFEAEPASRAWGIIHGVALLLGSLAVAVGFVAGLMYLVQARRLKLKLPATPGLRLPSLEWLEKLNSRAILLSTLLLTVGFLAGIIMNLIHQPQSAIPWTDPVVLSSGLMLVWLLAASIFNAVYRPARRGRKVAYLTLVSFVFLAVAVGLFLLSNNQHGAARAVAWLAAARSAS